MAVTNSDGSIILKTNVDTSGLNSGLKSITSGIKSIGKTALKASAAISAVAGAAIVALTKQAVSAYADYEQLVGGIDTLFKNSSAKLQKYASEAYRTAGVSANEFMQTVTSFSASLISSLGGDTDKAADVANMALIDMADNANKLGVPLERIQMAYQSFARQQYVLLDNLALGYQGTKTEMERLLADAEAITGVKYDISNLSDVYEAIHVIQTELGITGTTAKEAEKTITGSLNSTKAAWQDLMVSIASGKGIQQALDNFVNSLSSFAENIMPVIKRALDGFGQAFKEIMPDLVKMIVSTLIESIPVILEAIWEMLVAMFEGIVEGFKSLFSQETKVYSSSNKQVAEATKNQDKLTESVKKTEKALKGTLAGFDELNVLSEQLEDDALEVETSTPTYEFNADLGKIEDNLFETSKNNAQEMEKAVKSTIFETTQYDEFKYKVFAEVDPLAMENVKNSFVKAKDSFEELLSGEDGEGIDWAKIFGRYMTSEAQQASGALTLGAGLADIGTGVTQKDFGSAWQGIGEAAQGIMQINIGLRTLLGIDTSEMEALFMPISGELENIYKDMTTVQMAQIESFEKLFKPAFDDLKELGWSQNVIDNQDIKTVKTRFNNLRSVVVGNSEAIREEVIAKTSGLVAQGLMTDEEAAAILEASTKVQEEQVNNIDSAQVAIVEILRGAMGEKRELSFEEQMQISDIMEGAEDEYISIVSAGAGERQDILDKLEEYRDKMSTQRLSQIIVAANEEEKRRNEDADKEYEDTIKSANTLYKDLGIIDKKRYDEIVKNAKAERDKKYQEAHDSREEIVREAEKMAGEIADTVDLETGEIYSPWELMWNEMEGSARNAINSVLGFIESLNNWVFKVFNKIADFGEKLTGKKMMDFAELKIPRLATGAVIPGGREFLAVLGDQPAGQTNVEAPLATIKQAVAETLQELGGVSGQPITVEIDGREVFVAVKNAERRYGSQLIGGAY